MFKIVENPEFTHTVKVQVPVDGGHELQEFKARFRVIEDPDEALFVSVEAVKAYLRRLVIEMSDLADETGKALQWSDMIREAMLAQPHVRIALLHTYRAAVSKVRAGN